MSPHLGRSIVAATLIALALPAAVSATASEPPALPHLDPSTSRAASSDRFHAEVSSAPSGAPQSSRQTVQAATAPGLVSPSVTDVTSTEARLQWDIPTNNGSPLTGYDVQLLQDGNVIDEAVLDAASTAVWITELTPDTTYGFRIAAINEVGTGEFSAALSFTTSHFWLERVYGADRFETAVSVSQKAFPFEGVSAAFIANGLNFPDALAAAAAGGAFGGPVLLTRPTSVDASTVAEVEALRPEFVIAAGGKSVVSDPVLNKLAQYAPQGPLRADGFSRYDTAGWISQLWEQTDVVYLASGTNFPDALAGAAAAGATGAPVLLTRQDSLPEETAFYLAQLRPSRLVVLGGPGAVSDAAVNQAKAATGGTVSSTARYFGASRYDTAVDISQATFTTPRVPVVYIASGQNFADALAGAAAAGSAGGPVLLTQPNAISDATLEELHRLDPVQVVVLGGAAVISPEVYDQVLSTLRQP